MARQARVVVPGLPHHLTQRGNRRQQVFFSDADYRLYLRLAAEEFAAAAVEVWAYCLMPNHVHLIAVPSHESGLATAMGRTHLRYTRLINEREEWAGFLWQGRFASFPMDEERLLTCFRYVGLNPVRAGLVAAAADWPWSSVQAHLHGRPDPLVKREPLLDRCDDLAGFFEDDLAACDLVLFRKSSLSGRPAGSWAWLDAIEQSTGRDFTLGQVGRPRKSGTRTNFC